MALWKEHLEKWILEQELTVLHHNPVSGNIRLLLTKTENYSTWRELYMFWLKAYNLAMWEYQKYLHALQRWLKNQKRGVEPKTTPFTKVTPQQGTFENHWRTNFGIKYGAPVKVKCSECTGMCHCLKLWKRQAEICKPAKSREQKRKLRDLQGKIDLAEEALARHKRAKELKRDIIYARKVNACASWKNGDQNVIIEEEAKKESAGILNDI